MAKSNPTPVGSGGGVSLSAGLAGAGAAVNGAFAHDSDLASRCPFLNLFLTATVDDDGKPRKGATLMFFAEDGRFRAVLHERQLSLSLWRDADSLQGCLEGLEAALAGGRAEWRKDSKARRG